jgi:hypothetical protein
MTFKVESVNATLTDIKKSGLKKLCDKKGLTFQQVEVLAKLPAGYIEENTHLKPLKGVETEYVKVTLEIWQAMSRVFWTPEDLKALTEKSKTQSLEKSLQDFLGSTTTTTTTRVLH